MAQLVFTVVTQLSTQELSTIAPVDINGNPASVDAAGFVKETNEPGGSDVIVDPRDPNGNLNIICKPASEVGTTTTSGYIDADTGEGVKRIDIQIVHTTIPNEATGANLVSRGSEPVGAEG